MYEWYETPKGPIAIPEEEIVRAPNTAHEQKAAGVWFVYAFNNDPEPYPMFMSVDELTARRFAQTIGDWTYVKFWQFDTEWSN